MGSGKMKRSMIYPSSLIATLALSACSSAVTPAKLQQVADGMKTDQVTELLGQPTRIDHAEITGLTGEVYHYVSPKGDGRVVFINGAVFQTRFDTTEGHS